MMPSHRSGAEAERLGIPEAWHKGNGEADERAKQIARERDVPAVLLASHAQNLETAERVARTVAAIQLKRLQGRRQLACGAAVKERVRRLPGLPWRLRAKGVKRRKPGAGAAAEQQEGFSAGDLLQVKPGNWPALEAVLDLVQNDPCTVPEQAGWAVAAGRHVRVPQRALGGPLGLQPLPKASLRQLEGRGGCYDPVRADALAQHFGAT